MGGPVSAIASVASAGSSLLGSNKQAKAAGKATDAQLEMFNKVQENLQPYMDFGAGVLPVLNALMGIKPSANTNMPSGGGGTGTTANPLTAPPPTNTQPAFSPSGVPLVKGANMSTAAMPNNVQQTATTSNPTSGVNASGNFDSGVIQAALENLPGYQFTKYQGLKGLANSAAARGLSNSGAALKEAARYTTGLADTTFGEQFNRLMTAAGLGQNAAAGYGNNAVNASQGVASTILGQGTAQAGGIMGAGNAISGGVYANQLMNGMYGGGGGYTPGSYSPNRTYVDDFAWNS